MYPPMTRLVLIRRTDIYVTIVSSTHCVTPAGKYIATISTTVETDNPEAECAAGLALIEPVLEKYVTARVRHLFPLHFA